MAEFWGDGAGGALALTGAYVVGPVITIKTENFLHCQAVLSADATVAVDIQIELSFDAGQNWRVYDICPVVALPGGTTQHNYTIKTPVRCQIRMSMRRRGGTADSAAFVEAYLRELDGDNDETQPEVVNYAEVISDGAGAGLLLTGALQYGDDFEVGNGDRLEIIVTKTTANAPTTMTIQVEQVEGVLGHPLDAIDAIAAGAVTHSAMTIAATDIGAATPLYRLYRVDVEPQSTLRIGALFVGGTAPTILGFARVIRR